MYLNRNIRTHKSSWNFHSINWIYWSCFISTSWNVGSSTKVSLSHVRTTAGIAVQLKLKDLPIEASDTALLAGKLVLETNDVLKLSADTATDIKFIGSILETLN